MRAAMQRRCRGGSLTRQPREYGPKQGNLVYNAVSLKSKAETPGQMRLRSRLVIFGLEAAVLVLFTGCGGGPSAPQPDFSFSVAPSALPATVGTTSPPAAVAVVGQNGFTGTVTVAISGLPQGATSSPASPFTVFPGAIQQVTFSIPASAATGDVSVQFAASGGGLSKNALLTLKVMPTPVIQTYQDGSILFMEAVTGSETARVGLLTTWGGTIVEVSLNGINPVNSNDPGREVQVSLWDGDATYSDSYWGYNPVQAGDHYYHGSPVLEQALAPDSIYIKTQPLQWLPDNFGGDYANPVPGDAYVEQWLTPVPAYGRAFKVHYKITHFGNDAHANAQQEYPAVYVNRGFDTFEYYGGTDPWNYGAPSHYTMPLLPMTGPLLYTPELWGAYVDGNGSGLTVYIPGCYPYIHGFNAAGPTPEGTNYFVPFSIFTWAPGAVLESDIYVIAGPVSDARAVIYGLHGEGPYASPFPPYGIVDEPPPGSTLSGASATLGGWAFGTSPVDKVEVFVDGTDVGAATYGISRPDIPNAFPGQSADTGFQYALDTTRFPNGAHAITVKATDKAGHVATFPTLRVTINNP